MKTTLQIDPDIRKSKNIHQGKRCFILGNGPSLAKTNLNLLKNDICFACNNIRAIYTNTSWRTSYYVLVSEAGHHETMSDFEQNLHIHNQMGIPIIANTNYIDPFKCPRYHINNTLSNICFINCVGGRDYPFNEKHWAYDISKGATKHGSSLMALIQIATYMGFTNIYLLGCDLGYKNITNGIDINHFSTQYNFAEPNAEIYNPMMVSAHKLARQMCERIGVNIYNATIGGYLEVYERIEYEKLFN